MSKFLTAALGVTWFNENCHGGYEWDGVCLSVCAVLSIKFPVPFYMSLCNLMFNGNNNKKNTVFQSNVY